MEGKITSEMKYTVDTRIESYEVDGGKRLKPSSFMDLAQEMAYLAADAMGFGYDALMRDGTAWVLSRIRIIFHRMPLWREKVTISTWHKGVHGPFYLRDFTMDSEKGERLVSATSSWVVLDVESRGLVRTDRIIQMVPEDTICSDNAIETPADRVVPPRGVELQDIGTHTVRYSDVDLLGHTNNTRYVTWAMDCIPYEFLSEHPSREVAVAFNHETRPGAEVSLHTCEHEGSRFVEGTVDGRQVFCTRIDF